MKSLLKGKSFREKLLVFGLAISFVFGSYMMLRIKPLVVDIQKAEKNFKSQKKKYSRLLSETGDAKPSKMLERELEKLNKQLDQERQNLQGFDVSFIDLSNQEAKHSLIADITLAAEKNQLQVLSKQNEMRELAALVSSGEMSGSLTAANNRSNKKPKAPAKNNGSLQRHVFKLQVRGTFHSTYRFIQALQELRHSVLIARMKLSADDNVTFQGRRLVTTDLTLAI